MPSGPCVLGADDADRLVELIEGRVAGAVPVPKALKGDGSIFLALVCAENLEVRGALHPVARIVEADAGVDVALRLASLGLGRLDVEDTPQDGILGVLAWLAGRSR